MKATLNFALLTALFFPVISRADSVFAQWETIYNGPGNGDDFAWAVVVDSVGNVIVTGYSAGTSGEQEVYTAKYAGADGALLWDKRYNGPGSSDYDSGSAVAVDGSDNVVMTGKSAGTGGNSPVNANDYYTAKYAAADGALLWEKRYDGPKGSSDGAQAIAVDSAGNVIVTGGSSGLSGGNPLDYYTAKYAAADGALLWDKRYNGSGNNHDGALAIALDRAGNAIVTGWLGLSGGGREAYTAKYAASNGALLWERRGDSWEGGTVVVDGEGNAIVTGSFIGTGDDRGAYTVKYAALDGALLWERRNSATSTISMAVNHAGDAIVTGFSTGILGDMEAYTAKYAAADGALLWEKRYSGPGDGNDHARSVAVDSAGNAIVTVATGSGEPDVGDIYTVKYAAVDLDLDDDGLPDSWEIAHFGGTTGQSARDDTDGDGAMELLELAFGTDPKSPASVPAPAVVIEDGYLTTTIAKQPCVRYLVQTSASVGAGFSATNTTVLADTATTLKVRDNVLVGTQPARFLRVWVTATP